MFGLDLNIITLEVGLEHIGLLGGCFDAVIRIGSAHSAGADEQGARREQEGERIV